MPPQDVINRVQDMQAEGRLTGVVDDRGKFIYITMVELEAVARQVGFVCFYIIMCLIFKN